MEYLAKILGETRVENNNLWKYSFLDIETNEKDWFYHNQEINYSPDIFGKLKLTKDKFFKSFNQEITESEEKIKQDEILTELEGKVNYDTKKFSNDLPRKRIKLSLDPQHLHRLHQKGYTWKEVATIYEKHEQTIYYWLKTNGKFLQKRGRKAKVNQKAVSLLRAYIDNDDNPKTQQEMADYLSQQIGQRISRQTIGWWLDKLDITRKKLTYHYTLLDEKKAKVFNEEIKLLLPQFPFIALDECSFYPNLWPRFRYSLKGTRAVSRRPGHKGKHYTLLLAISSLKEKGVIHCKLTIF